MAFLADKMGVFRRVAVKPSPADSEFVDSALFHELVKDAINGSLADLRKKIFHFFVYPVGAGVFSG